jgi:hypothetical protein
VKSRAAIIDTLVLLLVWCGSLLVVNPVGDFPLNDDWSFGTTVNHFLESGEYQPVWAAMTLITNVLWGSLFCLPAGFSFNALRVSTLVAGFLGVLGCYLLLRQVRQPRSYSMLGALLLAFNPIYFALSNTFMTDVAFTALIVFAALFFARNLRSGSNVDLLLATSLALAATFSRQLAIAVPIAFAPCLLRARGAGPATVLRAVAPAAVCIASLIAFHSWLAASGRLNLVFDKISSHPFEVLGNPKLLVWGIWEHSFECLLYFGLFLLPILSIAAASTSWNLRRLLPALFAIVGVLGLIDVVRRYEYAKFAVMPVMPSIWTRYGIGPNLIGSADLLSQDQMPNLPLAFWIAVTAMSLCGAALLIVTLAERGGRLLKNLRSNRGLEGGKGDDLQTAGLFYLLTAFIYLAPFLIGGGFDRYVVPVMPIFLAGIAAISRPHTINSAAAKMVSVFAWLLLAAYALFSIGCTRDYLEWNRARWSALHDLLDNEHVPPAEINGGFEYNGLYLYDRDFSFNPDYEKENPNKFWWWIDRNTFIVSVAAIPGYTVAKEYSYSRWLPPRAAKVVVLRKQRPGARLNGAAAENQ